MHQSNLQMKEAYMKVLQLHDSCTVFNGTG
jgi:hypothetical protein